MYGLKPLLRYCPSTHLEGPGKPQKTSVKLCGTLFEIQAQNSSDFSYTMSFTINCGHVIVVCMLHRQSFWPNGCKVEPRLPRDEATRMRTRVAAKVALLSSLSGEY